MHGATRILPEPASMDLGPGVARFPRFKDIGGVVRTKDFARTIEERSESRPLRLRDDFPSMSHDDQISDFEYSPRRG